MLDKLQGLKEKYDILTEKISDPAIMGDQKEYTKILKERANLEPIVLKYEEYRSCKEQLAENKKSEAKRS